MCVRVRVFVILGDVLELFVTELAVEWTQDRGNFSLHLGFLGNSSLK